MIQVACWRRPDEGWGAWVFLPGAPFFVSGTGENVVTIAVETELNRRLPDFISYGLDWVYLGVRESHLMTVESTRQAMTEAVANR